MSLIKVRPLFSRRICAAPLGAAQPFEGPLQARVCRGQRPRGKMAHFSPKSEEILAISITKTFSKCWIRDSKLMTPCAVSRVSAFYGYDLGHRVHMVEGFIFDFRF